MIDEQGRLNRLEAGFQVQIKLKRPERFKKARSGILVQTTILVVILFIASSGLSYYYFNRSLNRLIEKSKTEFLAKRVQIMGSGYDFLEQTILEIQRLSGITASLAQAGVVFIDALQKKEVSEIQKIDNRLLKSMTDNLFADMSLIVVAIYGMDPLAPKPLIILTSDEELMYKELPPHLAKLIEEGDKTDYVYLEEGLPELELEGEYLVAYTGTSAAAGISYTTISFSSMHDEIAAMNDFYNKERESATLQTMLISSASIAALILITFVLLNLLLKKRITAPIDELAAAAESVLDGSLDVEVQVRRGEEFEGLKTAFNEMVVSLRNMLSKSPKD
ncbi:MAG: HAMP domain-containing protein [Actinobacteria bacterium]|nr:HAMP domain-containing protein [Actinomycetota bacterium]